MAGDFRPGIEGFLPASPTTQAEKDASELKQLGYAQELLREMGGFSNFAVSFSIISILTGSIQLFGYGLQNGGPLQMTLGWWLVSFFTLTVALSMAELASAYPTAGALYHWSSFLGGRAWGWFTACFNLIGLLGILAGVDYGLAQLLLGFLGWPATTSVNLAVYGALLLSHATFNHFGVRIVSWLNSFSAWYHMVVTFLLIGSLFWVGLAQPLSFLAERHHAEGYSYPYSFLIGLLLTQWIMTGYDASAHVTEETRDPGRTAPWGIVLAVGVSAVVGYLLIFTMTLSIPHLEQAIGFGDNAFAEILKLRLGVAYGNTMVALVLGAVWLCGLATLTSASRMVYAFARDGGLPFSKRLARVSQKHQTPSNAIWMLSLVALVMAASVKLYSAVVSIAVVALYLSYGSALGAALYARRRGQFRKGAWNLGAFGPFVGVIALLWVCFITVIFVLPPNVQAGAIIAGGVSMLAALWYLRVRHRFKGPPIAHPNLGESGAL
jgi:amino acid transporter